VLLLAPPPGSAHAEAARAGLENLARTLSIELARFGVRVVALHAGPGTGAANVAEVAAFLASRAGEYYSGCRFSLGAVGGSWRAAPREASTVDVRGGLDERRLGRGGSGS
jgi:hypothetical protein